MRQKPSQKFVTIDSDYINPIITKKRDRSKRFVTVRPTLERMMEAEQKRNSFVQLQPEVDHQHHNICCACSQRLTLKEQITSKLGSISSINLSRVVAKESDYKNKLSEEEI